MMESTVRVYLYHGTTLVCPDISQDGQPHYHDNHLKDHNLRTIMTLWPLALTRTAMFLTFNSPAADANAAAANGWGGNGRRHGTRCLCGRCRQYEYDTVPAATWPLRSS